MAKIKVYTEDTAEVTGDWVPWRDGIEFLIRPVPVAVNAKFERAYTRGLQTGQVSRQAAAQAAARGVEVTRERATYALRDSRGPLLDTKPGEPEKRGAGFELSVPASPAFIEELSELLQGDVKPGSDVCLDGRWTDELKAFVFRYIHLQKWISDKADEIAGHEAQEEAAAGKA